MKEEFTYNASTISFDVNNQDKLIFRQEKHDAPVQVYRANGSDVISEIPAGEMVMLHNYYRWIKDNNIQHDFLNPNGKKEPQEIEIHSRQDAFNAMAALEEYLLYVSRKPEDLEPFSRILHEMHDAAKTLVCQWHNLTGCKNQ